MGLGIVGTTKWVNASKIASSGADSGSEAATMGCKHIPSWQNPS